MSVTSSENFFRRGMLALLLLTPLTSQALTGADLKEICERSEASFQISCLMYVGGVSDGLNLAPGFYRRGEEADQEIICFPPGVKQAVRKKLVVNYLEMHGDQLELPAEVLIYMALREAWPCEATPPHDANGILDADSEDS